MRRWKSLSFEQKAEIIGVALGACFAAMLGFGGGLPARAIAVLIGAVIGWGAGRIVASVRGKK